MMKWILQLIGTAVCAWALGLPTTASAQEKITYNMAWLPQGSSIGTIAAAQRGWFKEAGLDVDIVRGYGGGRTANELDQGQFDIGYVDPISLVLNRNNGGKIRLVGAINTQWPGGICYVLKQGQKKSLDDMRGLQLGGGSASPVHNVVPAWLEMNGKPRDFIRLVRLDPAVVDISLIEGKVDLAECWLASNWPLLRKQAKAAGIALDWIRYSDLGLNAYGSGFAAREEYISKKPEVVRNFLRASYRGFDFARSNPDQAADIAVQMFPTLDRAVVLEQIREINDLITDPQVASKGLGYLREDRMGSTLSFLDKAFDLHGTIKLPDIYTNDLLTK
jgi:NitT/TauT family transport system substrate-binding protein